LTVAISTLNLVNASQDDELKAPAEKNKTAAQAEFDSALAEYERFLTTSTADAIVQARSRVAVAQANLNNARSNLLSLQTGEKSLQVIAAKAAADAAASGVKQAQAAVVQAQQALALAQLQLDRAAVKSPIEGVVMTRNIEIGDLVMAGGTVMRIAQLDTLNLVVYLPEDQYGQVSIGDSVSIEVDSFPNKVFSGEIVHIADEAEYTPKNVQTESGRKATVYAVKIQVENADHKLKPGMPADVEFQIH
jgi:RND family efflux transporter MFP subunit